MTDHKANMMKAIAECNKDAESGASEGLQGGQCNLFVKSFGSLEPDNVVVYSFCRSRPTCST